MNRNSWDVDSLRAADHAWWLGREESAIGYATEQAEYAQIHPRPTLKQFLISNAGQRQDEADAA